MSKKEWLKNLKPLEALNQLKNIPIYETSMYGDKYYYKGRLYDIYIYKRIVNIIKRTLEDYEKLKAQDENSKKLKALEIIKKKKVQVAYLHSMWDDFEITFNSNDEDVLWLYNEGRPKKEQLTKEEYELLKETPHYE